jgi:transposase, IS6 family
VEELRAERDTTVDHMSVYGRVQRFTPLLIAAARPGRHTPGDRWFIDETLMGEPGCRCRDPEGRTGRVRVEPLAG